jgi:hypothetical protein
MRPLAPPALALSLLLAACGGAGGSPSASNPGSGGVGGDGDLIAHPGGDAVVLRLDHAGGLVMPQFNLINLPAFSMLGDGRVIVPGAQIEIFPGPALPAVNVRRLNEAGVQAVLAAVAETGQFARSAEWVGAQNFVADASTATFTMHADDRDVTVSVHGLGTFGVGEPPPNFPADELPVHRALVPLVDRLSSLDSWIPANGWAEPEWQSYRPEAMRLVVRNADEDPPDDSGVPQEDKAWPVAGEAAAFGEIFFDTLRCGVVSGDDAQAWYAALEGANQLTRWTSGGHRYEVNVRFLLPDEPETCPAPA